MGFAIELCFDNQNNTIIQAIWQSLDQASISNSMLRQTYRPHITLAVAEKLDKHVCATQLKEITEIAPPIEHCLDVPLPMIVQIEEIILVEFSEHYYQELSSYPWSII